MGVAENNLKNKYEATLTRWQRTWRANSGQAWAGRVLDMKKGVLKLVDFGRVELWPKGTPDLIGFDSVVITPDMVGKRVAVFVGTELKGTKNDKLSKEQRNFKKLIVDMNGIHREIRENGDIIETTNLFDHP